MEEEIIVKENLIRSIFKSEITWLIGLVAGVGAFFYNVVLPINSIQIQLTQLQANIIQVQTYDNRITTNSNDIIKLQIQINNLLKQAQ